MMPVARIMSEAMRSVALPSTMAVASSQAELLSAAAAAEGGLGPLLFFGVIDQAGERDAAAADFLAVL